MKNNSEIFCWNCGEKLNSNMKYCSNCGSKLITNINYFQNYNGVQEINQTQKSENSISQIICAIVGLLFPIIGAILYYILKKTDLKAAKIANLCSWIGFLWQLAAIILIGFPVIKLL